ncbi:MAG: tRNA (adenosine(37)-N6)-threonylcarbamoyltransferase complex ATPase subunit type 1 TsaE [Desulforhopalus sp.]
MDTIQIHLYTLDDTEKLGRILGSFAGAGDVICLDGDLGAGKTALSQAIARGLEVAESCYVTSPSFAILHEYEGRMPMYHMDFYRLQDDSEVEDLGFDEYFYLTGLTVIEWSSRAVEVLPEEKLTLAIELNVDLTRLVTIKGTKRYSETLQQIRSEFQDQQI